MLGPSKKPGSPPITCLTSAPRLARTFEGFRDRQTASPMNCSSSWSVTWSPKKRSPAMRLAQWPGQGSTKGPAPLPWARWLRGWTAEENRHGDLLERLPPSHRPRGHARRRTDHPSPDRQRLQPEERLPIPTTCWSTRRSRSAPPASRTAMSDGLSAGGRLRTSPESASDRRRRIPARNVLHAHDGGCSNSIPAGGMLAFRSMLRGPSRCPAGSWTTARIPISSIISRSSPSAPASTPSTITRRSSITSSRPGTSPAERHRQAAKAQE